MKLSLDARAMRLLRRLPHSTLFGAAELIMLTLLAIVCARLVWAILTPVDPLGNWRLTDRTAGALSQRAQLFGQFDPFFRLAGGAPGQAVVVTTLQLKLFGTRINEASGQGSAILAGPDGVQQSWAVGEEIMPGVKLKSVAFDSVTIDRGGTDEQLFIDQSGGTAAAPAAPGAAPPAAPSATPVVDATLSGPPQRITQQSLQSGVQFAPRTENGSVTGLTLRPGGDGSIFRGAGFQEGDVLVSVNGQPIASPADAQAVAGRLTPGATVAVQVERGGSVVPVSISIARE